MSDVLSELLDLLQLETLEQNLYRGQSQNLGWGRIFGGQVVGQALSAASHTVPSDRVVHSLHAYFLRTGDVDKPIVYEVDRIRDGRSFTTRRVVAIQGGRAIFNLAASFQVAEDGFEHSDPMPEAPDPSTLLSEEQLGKLIADRIPPQFKPIALADRPIEIRPVAPLNPFKPTVRPPTKQIWLRAAGPVPDDPAVHRYLLAYASDFQLLTTALSPTGSAGSARGSRSPAWTTRCGSTAASAWTTGCSTTSTAPTRAAGGRWSAAASSTARAGWWRPSPRRG